ncbi:ATP-grasp domain-containing protein [Saccharicrinis sp. GN24d3]|uniref:ATP-grasp domain-containing protein n=1 Tax=Saccharicrinis sp. GN24d3 TaxID=3458416 RepID=UPI0040356AAF
MKIAIHNAEGSFSERWIPYCESHSIDYKLVNCYGTDIMQQLSDCDALMWHFNHKGPRESKFAKQLLFAVQKTGKKVFPNYDTVWHFDDKVAQKYLLEGVNAPLAPAYVFYSKKDANQWAASTDFPKVFKLRNGAGSDNVKLVRSLTEAKHLINKSFGKGFKQYDAWANLKERVRKYRKGKTSLWNVTKGVARIFHTTEYDRVTGKEMGYVYFQKFIPQNDYDIRVCVVGDKAFAIKRMVRENDFRASGSGTILYDKKYFDDETIKMAFDVSEKLNDQCMAYDFVFADGKPLIVEISYGFAKEGYDDCVGYWDRDMTWHEGKFNPYGWMVNDVVNSINSK